MKGLTHRERLFVEAYLSSGGNGTEAARRAGYRGSDKVLGIQAVRLLGKARVQEALRARTEKAIAAVGGPTPEDIIADLDEVRRGGRWFRVDPATGEPIIDLRALEAAGKLHLVKRVNRTSTTRTGAHDGVLPAADARHGAVGPLRFLGSAVELHQHGIVHVHAAPRHPRPLRALTARGEASASHPEVRQVGA